MPRPWYTRDNVRRQAILAGVFLFIVLLVAVLSRLNFSAPLIERVQAGFFRLGTGAGTAISRALASEQSLQANYARCEEDRRRLAIDQAAYLAALARVNELEELLAYAKTNDSGQVAAHVLSRAYDSDHTRIMIDQGANAKLLEGSAVVIGEGILYGFVTEVREQTSLVDLVSHPGSRVEAAILGKTRTIGLVEGREGALLAMEYVPKDTLLVAGDVVVTSGLNERVPEGLVIGLVTDVISEDSAPFQRAFIELLYEPREWTTVLVVMPPGV